MRGETLTLLSKEGGADAAVTPKLISKADTKSERFYLPPGAYSIRRNGRAISEHKLVSLKAGDTTELVFSTRLGTLKPTVDSTAAKSVTDTLIYIVEQQRSETTNRWREVARSAATTPVFALPAACLLYTSPSPRDLSTSRMPSSA